MNTVSVLRKARLVRSEVTSRLTDYKNRSH